MVTVIDDEFAFLDVPAGGVDLDEPPKSERQELPEEEIDARIMNPLTGSLIDTNNIDSLILGCIDAKKQLDDLRCFEDTLRRKLGEFTSGTAKTRRVKGKTLQAKLEMADEGWDQTILKEAYQSYPKFRDGYLGIGTVSVKLREFKKLSEMATDDVAFKQFKCMLEASVRPATGAPRVSLENSK